MSMIPLPVVLPLVVAAILAAAGTLLPRRALDIISTLTAAAVLAVCLWLLRTSADHTLVYWFGGWRPGGSRFPVGVCFVVDPMAAAIAALTALLVLASFVFSWAYFESLGALYHAMMLVFLAAMSGLCLTGDLFNLFVWFELMTATAVGLCGYESEEKGSLLGALNFAIMNTVGAFLSLTAVGMLYARTGALNMAEVGRTLAMHPPPKSFLAITFIFLSAGFLVKAAAFPFHFWLADAHAVAPTPVCILFSGIMVELGVYAIARIYWNVFATPFDAHAHAIRQLFLFIGSITALWPAVHCFSQRHFKRLLALSTVSHTGLIFVGFALLKPAALGGSMTYLVGHGLIKGTLFICAGILLDRFETVDEHELRGRGGEIWPIGILMAVGAWALAGLPPFATFFGEHGIGHTAENSGNGWVIYVAAAAEVITAAAVLRVTARIFLGWGKIREASSRGAPHIPNRRETSDDEPATPVVLWAPAVVLLLLSAALPLLPGSANRVQAASARSEQTAEYQSLVLDGRHPAPAEAPSIPPASFETRHVVVFLATALLALAPLFPRRFGLAKVGVSTTIRKALLPVRRLQSGRVADYIAWFTLGAAAYAVLLCVLAR